MTLGDGATVYRRVWVIAYLGASNIVSLRDWAIVTLGVRAIVTLGVWAMVTVGVWAIVTLETKLNREDKC